MPLHHQIEYAGSVRRLMAFVVDSLIISAISSALILGLFGFENLQQVSEASLSAQPDWGLVFLEYGLPALWVIGFWIAWQATPGKLLFDCQLVDARSLERPRMSQLVIRYLGYFASALPLGLGFAWALIDRRNQAWHDKLADTLVIMQDESLNPAGVWK